MNDTPSTVKKIPTWMTNASVHRKMAYALVVLAVVLGIDNYLYICRDGSKIKHLWKNKKNVGYRDMVLLGG